MLKRTVPLFITLSMVAAVAASCNAPQKAPVAQSATDPNQPPAEQGLEIRKADNVAFDDKSSISAEAKQEAANIVNSFSVRLLAAAFGSKEQPGILQNPASDNLAMSGLSIFQALATTLPAYKDGSVARKDILEKIYFNKSQPEALKVANAIYRDSLGWVKDKSAVSFDVFNQTYLDEGSEPSQAYLEDIKTHFDAGVAFEKFSKDRIGSIERINKVVSNKTKQLIPELLKDEDLAPDFKAIILNTLYFEAKWAFPFDEEATIMADFTPQSGDKKQVEMMVSGDKDLSYYESKSLRAIALPYAKTDARMFVVLPEEGETVGSVLGTWQQDPNALADVLATAETRKVAVRLPKFNLVSPLMKLADSLKAMGINMAGPISKVVQVPNDEYDVNQVLHKSVLIVDEGGTKAAAATVVTDGPTSTAPSEEKPIEFYVDRPAIMLLVAGDPAVVVMGVMLQQP